ncbi:hypothetical protein SAMN05444358_103274 [Ruegeria halocynthiae]|uniref:Resolvase, N terminal domain n=1 Tax=Ruegeria halocynthiae TaxID=985054 RepID=A0A1H2ZKT4_9RHOB|nr:hypothetical protein [Ruegeria halocynthiae]SDX18020.1 hypothetical protein SAMN05444358_103274 [Ruegeria halocynthiae]
MKLHAYLSLSRHGIYYFRRPIDVVGADLSILGLSLDTSADQGKLMLNLLGGVAEFEREIVLELPANWNAAG